MTRIFKIVGVVSIVMLFAAAAAAQATDPLPSWNEGKSKEAIIEFVRQVTGSGSAQFVPPAERIAVFDNDGTLWCERPMPVELAFALDRLKTLAPQHPEWKDEQPFKGALEGNMKTLVAGGQKALLELIVATHTGMTTEQFAQIVEDWIITARHPRTGRLYTDMVYQPMLELLAYLRANGFKIFIVSGGGIEFMRPWTDGVYGVPPEQVVGSSVQTKFEIRNGKPVLVRLPKVNFTDDGAGKPVGINQHIGLRPIFAFGNSDGDLEMLQWTTDVSGPRFGGLVHHTDAVREYAYDKDSPFGRLDKALKAAKIEGWTIVDMKRDWKIIYPKR